MVSQTLLEKIKDGALTRALSFCPNLSFAKKTAPFMRGRDKIAPYNMAIPLTIYF
jgi:hypothetical protein